MGELGTITIIASPSPEIVAFLEDVSWYGERALGLSVEAVYEIKYGRTSESKEPVFEKGGGA